MNAAKNKMKVNSEWEDKREKRQGWNKLQLRTTNICGNLSCGTMRIKVKLICTLLY